MATVKTEWLLPLVIAGVSLAVSSWASYTSNDKELTSRVTAIETQQKNDLKSIDRIETKLDKLYEYLTGRKP
jgi:hypothetical protein